MTATRRMLLYHRGGTPAPESALETLRALPGVVVREEVPGRLMLVEGDETVIRDAVAGLTSWSAHPEVLYPPPVKR